MKDKCQKVSWKGGNVDLQWDITFITYTNCCLIYKNKLFYHITMQNLIQSFFCTRDDTGNLEENNY